ncbi:F-box only protein 8-like [Heracleum sosnowskyi]|uniref:F-box only protein 8-like n=1 Tax=Heracleum sosnowskyi TaxID=360622 RepID=A0AAD8JI04_9APIA|nr:F-box only protein 8-like [Heracleum sosnowskyi]
MALSLQRYTRPDEMNSFTQFLKLRTMKVKERSMLIALEKIVCYLPENLIFEILSRLSVKDLLQFKSVCKSWCDIISSPVFVSKHLNNYYNNNDDWRGCLLAQFYVSHAEIQLYDKLVDETPRVVDYEILYNMPMYCSYVCGPCDGLYYVYQYYSDGRALWNPAINELKTLPEIIRKPDFPDEFTYARNEVYGFGFDHVTGDYKVVVMKSYWKLDRESNLKHHVSVLVYSLRADSWRYCGDLAKAYDLKRNKCYIYVNGCCYWLGSFGYRSEVIISFDMANDSFKEIDVPDNVLPSSKCLAVYDDSLVYLSLRETGKIFDIWSWSEEGCWTKKFSVGPLPHFSCPIGHWKGNRLILQSGDGKLLLYDPDTQETEDLAFKNLMQCQGVYAYMESLVSIKDQIQNEAGQQPEDS